MGPSAPDVKLIAFWHPVARSQDAYGELSYVFEVFSGAYSGVSAIEGLTDVLL